MTKLVAMIVLASAFAACGGEEPAPSIADAGPRDAAPACVQNPTTHLELINACTDAQHVEKSPRLPLLRADGTLPPLP